MTLQFSVERESRRATSSSGGKDYHLVLVSNNNTGACLLVMRWAKAGQWGNGIKVERYVSFKGGNAAWIKMERLKFGGDYREVIIPRNKKDHGTVPELQRALGSQYWHKLGDHLEWLIPGVGMGGKPAEEPAVFDETERTFRRASRATTAESFAEPAPSIEELIKDNPAWGSW